MRNKNTLLKTLLFSFLLTFLTLNSFLNKTYGQEFSTKGKDFWMGFMQNYNSTADLSIYVTSTLATSGTVTIPGLSWSQAFSVAANSTSMISIPMSAMAVANGSVENVGIRIQANDTVSVFALNYQAYTADAAVIFPVGSLDREYRVQTIVGWPGEWGVEYMVVATADNTTIQITPFGGAPYNVTLNSGQVFQVQSTGDLSGAVVKSLGNCSKIAVYSGNVCTNIGGCVACDHLYEQLLPISRWGMNYITVPLVGKSQDYFRIIANENATSVSINGGAPFNLSAGQVQQSSSNQPRFINSTKPIEIIQYAQGGSCDGVGDPFSVLVPPIEQFINNITFNAFTSSIITSYYVNIVTKTNSTAILTLDGSPRPFSAVPANPAYSYAQIAISQGNHTLLSDSGFIAQVYGWGSYESYGYCTGFSLKNLNYNFYISETDTICSTPGVSPPLDTVCPHERLCFKVPVLYANIVAYNWNFGDGTTATGPVVMHEYNTYGSFLVSLTLTTADGCSTTVIQKTIYIVQLDVNVTPNGPTTFCDGNNVILSAGGPYSNYLWSTTANTQTINVNVTGTYAVTVTDARGCQGSNSLAVTVNPNPVPQITPNGPTTFCQGGSVVLDAGTPYSIYNWSTTASSQTITVNATGTYAVTVTDANACKGTTSIPVTVNPLPVVQLTSIGSYCISAPSFTLSQGTPVGGAYSGTGVSSGIFNPSVAGAGTFNITYVYTDGNTCTDSATNTVTVNPLPVVTMSALGEICVNASPLTLIVGSPTGGIYSGTGVSLGSFDPAIAGVGTFTIKYTYSDANSCVDSTTGNIIVNPLPTLSVTPNQTICNGDIATLVATSIPNATFLWSTSSVNDTILVNPSATTTYTVTATDQHNCGTISSQVVVSVNPLPTAYAGPDVAICQGDSTTLTATGIPFSSFLWSTGQTTPSITVSPTTTTTYIVSVTDQYNCATATDDVVVTFYPSSVAQFTFTPDTGIFTNELITFTNNSVNSATYLWNFGDAMTSTQVNPYHMYNVPGTYNITLITTSPNGCLDTTVVLVNVIEGLIIPNVFTPNGDGYNDVFQVITSGIIDYDLQIYNRWGVLLFESSSTAIHWDGRTNAGVEAAEGTYFYILTAKSGTKDYSRTGTITLLR